MGHAAREMGEGKQVLALKISGRADRVFRLVRLLARTRGKTTLGDLKKGDPSCLVLSLPKSRNS